MFNIYRSSRLVKGKISAHEKARTGRRPRPGQAAGDAGTHYQRGIRRADLHHFVKHRAGERRCPASAVPPILQIPSGISDFRGDLTCIDKHAALKAKSLSIRRIPVRSPAQQIRFESREQQNEHTMGFAIKNSLQAIYRLQRVGQSVIKGSVKA